MDKNESEARAPTVIYMPPDRHTGDAAAQALQATELTDDQGTREPNERRFVVTVNKRTLGPPPEAYTDFITSASPEIDPLMLGAFEDAVRQSVAAGSHSETAPQANDG
jgi:hypothetical protein